MHQIYQLFASLAVILVLTGTVSAVDTRSLPNSLELRYTVSVGSAELGSLLTQLRASDDGYEVNSETRAEGVASILLGGSLRENCRFTVDGDTLRPRSYEVTSKGRKTYQHDVEFDWGAGEIKFSNGEKVTMPQAGYVIDNCSVPFAFMLSGANLSKAGQLHVVGGKRIRHYENIRISKEDIDTPLGQLGTLRIEQQRVGKPERKLTIWLATDKQQLPVKITERRKSRTTTMLLRSVEGI